MADLFSCVETTVHHWEPDEHDKVTGVPGSFRSVLKNLETLKASGSSRAGIAVNITPVTAGHVFDIVKAVKVSGVSLDYIVLQRIIPLGRASRASNLTLTRSDVDDVLPALEKVERELGVEVTVEDPFPLCVVPDRYRRFMRRCEWGYSKASVDHLGNLSRCGADPRYRLGNVFEAPLQEIWAASGILASFRGKEYLPGRCRVCGELDRCGGGCPLSCEIERDHGIDYLYSEFERLDRVVHGDLSFRPAREEELSSILQIEWGNFKGYGHIFSVDSIRYWFAHNPGMFFIVRDSLNWVLAYATIVPITQKLYERILHGEVSSHSQFSPEEVVPGMDSDHWHLEVIATVPSRSFARVGGYLIREVGSFLTTHAKYVTTSPITEIGKRLCSYFGFEEVATESFGCESYPIFRICIDPDDVKKRLAKY